MSEFEVIDNTSDFLDSREIDARIEYLNDEFDDDADSLNDDELQELIDLKSLKEDLEPYSPDWQYGSTLINDSYFTEYAEDLVKDCYGLDNIPDFIYIDWKRTASEVQIDYSSAEFNGEIFWVR